MKKFIAYYRVSTQRQGQSGLGLEAQQSAVAAFVGDTGILSSYTEIESGRKCDRPQLAEALAECKGIGATLVIAKLDRLARNVHFITGLLESGVDIVAADMPEADRTFLQMAAVFAEWEARKISERTKDALKAAKARGQKLGSPNPKAGGKAAGVLRAAKTDAIRIKAWPIVFKLHAGGISLRQIASTLNDAGIPAAMGGKWHAATVSNLIKGA